MYIAMNRFQVKRGDEQTFVEIWRARDSHLKEVPGFVDFHLLRGPQTDTYTLFASHTVWASQQAFVDWTHSQAFRQAHANAGKTPRDIYLGPPQLECFEAVL